MARRLIEQDNMVACEWDTDKWPTVSVETMPDKWRDTFSRRKLAVDMYMRGTSLAVIRDSAGLSNDEVVRLVKRCVSVDEHGLTLGYRALIPYKRISPYVRRNGQTGTKGTAGQFQSLLDTNTCLQDLIHDLYLDRRKRRPRERVRSFVNIHQNFLSKCREIGISSHEYPFTSSDGAYRSLVRYCKGLDARFFVEVAGRHGDSAKSAAKLVHLGVPDRSIIRPFERIQFDGHRIDAILAVQLRTPEGDLIPRVLHRIWLLTAVDVATGAVLGYSLSLNREYTSSDVLRCIRNAVVPHSNMVFTIPGLHYPAFDHPTDGQIEGGFPSDFFAEARWAMFDEIALDNGKANLSHVVIDHLANVLKCNVGPGPVGQPQRRGLIERFYGVLEERGFHRLVNTTGSSPNDPRRKEAEKQAMKYAVTFEHLKELTEVLIAQYNLTPHYRTNNLTPIEAMRQRIQERGMWPRQVPEEERREMILVQKLVKRKVRGSVKTGRRPYIGYMGVNYRSTLLDESSFLIGTELTLRVDLDDLRVITAFLPDGSEFGNIVAEGKWAHAPHSEEIRRSIMDLKTKQRLQITVDDDPIELYHRYLEEVAPTERVSRNRLVQVNETQVRMDEPSQLESSASMRVKSQVRRREQTAKESATGDQRDPSRLFRGTLNL